MNSDILVTSRVRGPTWPEEEHDNDTLVTARLARKGLTMNRDALVTSIVQRPTWPYEEHASDTLVTSRVQRPT